MVMTRPEKSPFPGMATLLRGPSYGESSGAQCPEWDEPWKDQLTGPSGNLCLTVKAVHTSNEQETQHSSNGTDP